MNLSVLPRTPYWHPRIRYGSHLPLLIKAVQATHGPVLEIGAGIYSTPFLHWACYLEQRPLWTYESDAIFMPFANAFASEFHHVMHVTDWNEMDVSPAWSVALVDHDPGLRRKDDIARLTHAEYVVVHDTERNRIRRYQYKRAFDLFRYRRSFMIGKYGTTVLSNIHDMQELFP